MAEKNNQKSNNNQSGFNPAFFALGIGVGLMLGSAFGSVGIGLCFGSAFGLLLSSIVPFGNTADKEEPTEEDDDNEQNKL